MIALPLLQDRLRIDEEPAFPFNKRKPTPEEVRFDGIQLQHMRDAYTAWVQYRADEDRRQRDEKRRSQLTSDSAELVQRLDMLLPHVKNNDNARLEFIDILHILDPADPKVDEYLRKLGSAFH
jgi:hypothetical protein